MSIKPITPSETLKAQKDKIPDFVIEVVNNLIIKHYNKNGFRIYQRDIKDLVSLRIDCDFDIRWLDFEKLYDDFGWKVTYDKPAFNETYLPYFSFKEK